MRTRAVPRCRQCGNQSPNWRSQTLLLPAAAEFPRPNIIATFHNTKRGHFSKIRQAGTRTSGLRLKSARMITLFF